MRRKRCSGNGGRQWKNSRRKIRRYERGQTSGERSRRRERSRAADRLRDRCGIRVALRAEAVWIDADAETCAKYSLLVEPVRNAESRANVAPAHVDAGIVWSTCHRS